MKVCILGGGSCFAQNLANLLESKDIDHFGIGRSPPKEAAFWVVHASYRYYQAHLVDDLDAAMEILRNEQPAVIVNFAAQGEGAHSFGVLAPDFFRTNTWGMVRLVRALHEQRLALKRFIHISTSELYGSTAAPADERTPLRPTSPYALSKACFDQYLEIAYWQNSWPMNIIRPSNCYTPGQQLHRVIPRAIICALNGTKLPLHGGGVAKKSYLHATDLSRAILDVIEQETPPGYIYNVAPVAPISIRDLVRAVATACEVPFEDLVEEVPERPGQDAVYHLDARRIAHHLGWTQTIGLERGLQDMVAWVRARPELLTMDSSYRHKP